MGQILFHLLCLDETRSGAVVTVDSESGGVDFVNSSIELFAHSVFLERQHRGKSLARELPRLDPPCLDEGTFWSGHLANEG